MAWNASANASAAATTVFTADNEHIFTVTLDLSVQGCKNAILSLANVACSAESIECSLSYTGCMPELLLQIYTVLA